MLEDPTFQANRVDINGSPPLAARRPFGRRCRSESRADRKRPQQRTGRLRSARLSLLPPREARRRQRAESVEVTHKVFLWLFVLLVIFLDVASSRRRVVAASVPKPAQRS